LLINNIECYSSLENYFNLKLKFPSSFIYSCFAHDKYRKYLYQYLMSLILIYSNLVYHNSNQYHLLSHPIFFPIKNDQILMHFSPALKHNTTQNDLEFELSDMLEVNLFCSYIPNPIFSTIQQNKNYLLWSTDYRIWSIFVIMRLIRFQIALTSIRKIRNSNFFTTY
jgi:hypothetical protein